VLAVPSVALGGAAERPALQAQNSTTLYL